MYLTGGLRIDGDAGCVSDADFPGPQGRVALAALVLERRPLSRDALAEIVWGDRLPDKWDGAVSAIMSKIRSLVTRTGLDARSVISSVGGTYAVHLPSDSWVDVEDALRRLDRADGALRHGDIATATAEGTAASAVLRRPFLAGVDTDWVETQRRRLRTSLYDCSTVLAAAWMAAGDHRLAATVATTAIEVDPLRELGHRLLMEAEWRRGDRGAALRALSRCQAMLFDELGVDPSPETLELAAAIRSS